MENLSPCNLCKGSFMLHGVTVVGIIAMSTYFHACLLPGSDNLAVDKGEWLCINRQSSRTISSFKEINREIRHGWLARNVAKRRNPTFKAVKQIRIQSSLSVMERNSCLAVQVVCLLQGNQARGKSK